MKSKLEKEQQFNHILNKGKKLIDKINNNLYEKEEVSTFKVNNNFDNPYINPFQNVIDDDQEATKNTHNLFDKIELMNYSVEDIATKNLETEEADEQYSNISKQTLLNENINIKDYNNFDIKILNFEVFNKKYFSNFLNNIKTSILCLECKVPLFKTENTNNVFYDTFK